MENAEKRLPRPDLLWIGLEERPNHKREAATGGGGGGRDVSVKEGPNAIPLDQKQQNMHCQSFSMHNIILSFILLICISLTVGS